MIHSDGSYETMFNEKKEILLPNMLQYEPFHEDVDSVLENVDFEPDVHRHVGVKFPQKWSKREVI